MGMMLPLRRGAHLEARKETKIKQGNMDQLWDMIQGTTLGFDTTKRKLEGKASSSSAKKIKDGAKKDDAKKDGAKKDGAKKDGAKKDGAKKDGAKKDGAKKDDAKKDGAKKDGTKKDGAKKGEVKDEEDVPPLQ